MHQQNILAHNDLIIFPVYNELYFVSLVQASIAEI